MHIHSITEGIIHHFFAFTNPLPIRLSSDFILSFVYFIRISFNLTLINFSSFIFLLEFITDLQGFILIQDFISLDITIHSKGFITNFMHITRTIRFFILSHFMLRKMYLWNEQASWNKLWLYLRKMDRLNVYLPMQSLHKIHYHNITSISLIVNYTLFIDLEGCSLDINYKKRPSCIVILFFSLIIHLVYQILSKNHIIYRCSLLQYHLYHFNYRKLIS